MNVQVSKRTIAIIIMSILLIGGIVWWWVARENRYKDQITQLKKEKYDAETKLLACLNAPADTSYHHNVINLPASDIVVPKPKKPPTSSNGISVKDSSFVAVKDTLPVECPKEYYNDTVKKDNYAVNLEIFGHVRWYRILGISLDQEYMIIKKNQVVIHYDTAWLPAKIKTWQWGVDGSMNIKNFNELPGFGVGGFAILQEKLLMGLGVKYWNQFGGEVRIGYIIGGK